jgi:hypothetical protein
VEIKGVLCLAFGSHRRPLKKRSSSEPEEKSTDDTKVEKSRSCKRYSHMPKYSQCIHQDGYTHREHTEDLQSLLLATPSMISVKSEVYQDTGAYTLHPFRATRTSVIVRAGYRKMQSF